MRIITAIIMVALTSIAGCAGIADLQTHLTQLPAMLAAPDDGGGALKHEHLILVSWFVAAVTSFNYAAFVAYRFKALSNNEWRTDDAADIFIHMLSFFVAAMLLVWWAAVTELDVLGALDWVATLMAKSHALPVGGTSALVYAVATATTLSAGCSSTIAFRSLAKEETSYD